MSTINDGQRVALKTAFETSRHFALLGGPGTGKSWTMVLICRKLLRMGYAVIAVAPKCSVCDELRKLKAEEFSNSKSFFVDTLQGFVCNNSEPSATRGRSQAFLSRIDPNSSPRSDAYFPVSAKGMVVGLVGECFSASAGQIDEFWSCIQMLPTVSAERMMLEGDPGQLTPPHGLFASCSSIFQRDGQQRTQLKMSVLTVSERFRKCNTMLSVVHDLRDIRFGLRRSTLDTLLHRVLSHRQRAGSIFLTPTHKGVEKKRKSLWKKSQFRIKVQAVRPKGSRKCPSEFTPPDSYVVKGEPIMFTTNYRDNEDKNFIIPNGTLATAMSWPFCSRPGFTEIKADDEVVNHVVVRLNDGKTVDIFPVRLNGWLFWPVTDGRARTIHGSQGMTYAGQISMDMTNSYNHRMLLMVMLSRVKSWGQISSLTGIDDVVAMQTGGPPDQVHDRFVRNVLHVEEQIRHRNYLRSREATFICLKRFARSLPENILKLVWKFIEFPTPHLYRLGYF